MIKMAIRKEDVKIINIYVPNNRTSKYVKQRLMELKGERDHYTVGAGGFSARSSVGCVTTNRD